MNKMFFLLFLLLIFAPCSLIYGLEIKPPSIDLGIIKDCTEVLEYKFLIRNNEKQNIYLENTRIKGVLDINKIYHDDQPKVVESKILIKDSIFEKSPLLTHLMQGYWWHSVPCSCVSTAVKLPR